MSLSLTETSFEEPSLAATKERFFGGLSSMFFALVAVLLQLLGPSTYKNAAYCCDEFILGNALKRATDGRFAGATKDLPIGVPVQGLEVKLGNSCRRPA